MPELKTTQGTPPPNSKMILTLDDDGSQESSKEHERQQLEHQGDVASVRKPCRGKGGWPSTTWPGEPRHNLFKSEARPLAPTSPGRSPKVSFQPEVHIQDLHLPRTRVSKSAAPAPREFGCLVPVLQLLGSQESRDSTSLCLPRS